MIRRNAARGIAGIILAGVLASTTVSGVRAQEAAEAAAASYSEDDVKAAFLYNFANYVEWPRPDGADAAPITFAVFGAASVEAALEQFVRGRTLQGRPVTVRRLRSINDLDGDDVVFIGTDENYRLRQLIAAVQGPTLIVTDAPDGLAEGAMINFQVIDRRVRFEIAVPAAEEAGLTLSSRLLSAALRVETTRCDTRCLELNHVQPLFSSAPLSARVITAALHTPTGGRRVPESAASAWSRVVIEVEAKT